MADLNTNKIYADEIRKEFAAQSDHDLIMWKSSISDPNFKTITEHVKEEAEKFIQTIPF
ncbi:hypothetical protein N9878_01065 [bacterium]|nr:hypothetical protein [bacterium]